MVATSEISIPCRKPYLIIIDVPIRLAQQPVADTEAVLSRAHAAAMTAEKLTAGRDGNGIRTCPFGKPG
jgi:hypothetical protein